ncbi:BN159_2729 family protein [Streptomyces lincolnensis]|uniref:BN159_2729 family protein n=1 Tax=Streptomyces lincolnensis TaxID=1915 RepID=UPI001E6554C1|nr:BN159_2729 family protein [Streptomyces lincolnensis]MCD7440295.1 BN159_2729 family protein [Streptomyces lincolnensis]
MNKNLPHAVRVIRTALASSGSDPAAAIAHALDGVGMLVDPERTFGMVLKRKSADDEAREHQEQQPELTDLEQQALVWDESCERARRVAAVIQRHIGEHPSVQNIQLDGDRILVSLHIVNQSQWGEWRRYFGIQHDKETALPYMVAGDGHRDGVRVGVVAYDLPQARAHAKEIAKAPFEFEGIVYDLALPQQDARGDVWFYQGVRTADGMPLLSVDGRPERCTLASIVQHAGPVTPVTGTPSQQVTPVMTGGETA